MSQQATAYEPLVPVAMIVAMAKNRVIGSIKMDISTV